MGSASNTLASGVGAFVFNLTGAKTPEANYYIALYTAAPTAAGGGTEVAGNGYGRIQVTNDNTTWGQVGNVVSNIIPITFGGPSPAAWGTVTHFGLHRANVGDVLDLFAALTNSRVTAVGQALTFAAGELAVTVS